MRPEERSRELLGITRSKAKMYEYSVPTEDHIEIRIDPSRLFSLTLGILGDHVGAGNKRSSKMQEIKDLLFSAQYFDSYISSNLNDEVTPYLLLLGSASYYLCDFPGSSKVLALRLKNGLPNLACLELEKLLFTLLTSIDIEVNKESIFYSEIISIKRNLSTYYKNGINSGRIVRTANEIREYTYLYGTPRQLLMSDIIYSVLEKKIDRSTWTSLKKYTNIKKSLWRDIVGKDNFIQEFWPSQILLGEKQVFNGKSAVIQMPTSAGKTKSIEIIIRSSILSNRSRLIIIVAPFRALCSEIRNNLVEAFTGENISVDTPSDVFQVDFEELEITDDNNPLVLVLTPEKLIYMIRHAPELADSVGLLIYDEAHQFDSGVRGVTYELLLSSLKRLIPSTVQTVLISAVISNATEIANWIGKEVEVVSGTNLHPTYRTLAFSEWKDPKGRLNFVDIENPEKLEYFVPRLIEQKALSKNPREKERIFPNKDSGPDIAIYLGIKMVPKGSVAIFCGTKKTVASICNRIVELKDRNYESSYPNSYSNMEELKKLTSMISKHFGVSNSLTICSELGIFAHSGNTPQGLRLAIEYAMQKGLVKYVVCTSTLAQGVNLPIKYLVITSIYQGVDKISTRDFHNLIGRAGRSGIHTEGSIIFADPEVYDQKESYSNSSKWKSVKSLLDAQTTKPCVSTILEIFNPLLSDSGQYIQNVRPMDYVNYYVNNQGNLSDIADKMAKKYNRVGFSIENLQRQILDKFSIITAIESYLMAYSNENSSKLEESEVVDLAKATLAYHSSATEFRANIVDLFIKISDQINLFYNDGKKRKTFGKTLFGVKDLLHIEKWAMDNYGNLLLTESSQDLLESFWPIISQKITNSTFKKITPTKNLFLLAQDWISGVSYNELYQSFISNKSKIIAGKQFRQPSIEKVVELCDNVFAFEATLIVAAVRETIEYNFPEDETNELSERINVFQKQLKYGLSSELAIIFHEIGFSDRVIAQEMENVKPKLKSKKSFVKRELRRNVKYRTIVDKFPSYYGIIYSELLKNAL